ncbi:MAG: ParB/Srx family N-terminal domain-containing protein [Cetobacterium sp.]
MEIILKKISELKQYKKNAKLHPDWQIKQIADSIEKFGFNDPIAIDENGVIIEGHGRFLACKMLEVKEVPTICLDHMTVQEKKAYILAHNKINMNTEFDYDILKEELTEITDFDLSFVGFTDFEIEEMMVVEEEEEMLELNDYIEEDEGNSKKLNGLVCPECGVRHKIKEFLECEING